MLRKFWNTTMIQIYTRTKNSELSLSKKYYGMGKATITGVTKHNAMVKDRHSTM